MASLARRPERFGKQNHQQGYTPLSANGCRVKGEIALSTGDRDMEFLAELFVAGAATDNFLSSLRRIAYPFDGTRRALPRRYVLRSPEAIIVPKYCFRKLRQATIWSLH
jgi:hypothetical protein